MYDNKRNIKDAADDTKGEEVNQYVTFLVGDETYGVSVMKVQSLNEMIEITHVPKARAFIKGVINLRGSVIPVIDMRRKFSLPPKEYDSFTVILIVEVNERLVGMIVDAVSDVVNIPLSDIQSQINYSARVDTSSIEGIGRIGESLVVLLDVETFLSGDSLSEG
jgi:purine-binding chemotaxis protein CheW